MGHILKIFLWISFFSASINLKGQQIENGLWNTGIAYSIVPADHNTSAHCILLKQLIKTNLYPGVAVVENEYVLVADSNFNGNFLLPDSPKITQSIIGNIHPLSSQNVSFYINKSDTISLPVTRNNEGYLLMMTLHQNDTLRLISRQLLQTNQSLMAKDGGTKENNAVSLVFNNYGWKRQGVRKALIHLKDKLNLIGIYGVSPDKMVLGDLTHLVYNYDISRDSVLLIWFEGAAPDFKFEKKILPYKDALFNELKKFDEHSFQIEKFRIIDKNDFGTNKQSKILSILYFVMFAVPWIILAAFIIFLIFRKKKTKSTS